MIETQASTRFDRVNILGTPVDCVTMDQALAAIEGFIAAKAPHHVVTADSSGLVIAQSDPDFKAIMDRADLVTPDSAGVLWAMRRKGIRIPERVSGGSPARRVSTAGFASRRQ